MKKSKVFMISICAIMAAMAVVLSRFATIPITKSLELSLYGIPLIFVSIVFGPKCGLVVGLLAGVVDQLTSPYGISIETPFWMLAPIAWSFISGLMNNLLKGKMKNKWLLYLIVISVTALVANFMNTIALTASNYFYTKDFNQCLAYFIANVFTRFISLPIHILVYTIICLLVCERVKKYIYGDDYN